MTDQAIINVLANTIDHATCTAPKPTPRDEFMNFIAAAVLDLVRPKRLVYARDETGLYVTSPGNGMPIMFDARGNIGTQWMLFVNGRWLPFLDLSAAQSAAQSHADAAHWMNTKLGELVGVK